MKIDKYFMKRAYSNNRFREVRAKVNRFLNMEFLHNQLNLDEYLDDKKQAVQAHRSFRDELVDKFVQGINKQRLGTKYKPITHKEVALRINRNPFFRGRDGEVELLFKTCDQKGNFSKFFWVCPLNKKQDELQEKTKTQ